MKAIPYMHDFFGELPEEIQREIHSKSVERKVASGQTVYAKDDASTEMYRIVEGSIKLCNYSYEGDEMITGHFRVGDCFGEMGLIDGLPRVSHAVAAQETNLSVLSGNEFDRLRDTYSEINRAINIVLCRRVRFLYSLNEESAGLKLIVRLARVLHRLAYSHGAAGENGNLDIKISHEELSKMLGASRQSVSKELKILEKEGEIDLQYGKICIPNLERLSNKYETAIGIQQVTALYSDTNPQP
jgi:CRP-like cAMP-binding protein